MTRGAAVAAVSLAVLLIATMATPALAAVAPHGDTTPQTNGSAVASEGPFGIEELRTGGDQPSAAPPSVRYVGGTEVDGAVAVRYRPADPLSNEPVYLEGGQTLNTDEIELYSTVFGESTGDYELVITYWQPETRQTENGTAVDVAANQEVQRATVTIEDGYATAPVALNSHYEQTYQATMWLEQDGDPVDGARWRFEHASAPASQQVQIETQADAWWYAFTTAIIPGVASIIMGLSGAKATLKLAGRGPGYSLATWGVVSVFGIVSVLGGLYNEVATVVANFELLMGLSLLPIAYGGGLRMAPAIEKIAFERKELTSSKSLRRESETGADPDVAADGGETASSSVAFGDDDYHDELYEDMLVLPTIRAQDSGRLLPKKGIRPFFARLFASAARLDLSDLRTRVRVNGSASQKIYVDPESEGAVDHKPAHLRRRMPVWHRLPEPDEGESLSWVTRGLFGLFTVATVAAPLIGWQVGRMVMNTPTVGFGVGLLLLALESYEAVDGSIDFEPAPRHDVTADASLTVLQSEHADAKTIEEMEEVVWDERMRTAKEARDIESRRSKSLVLSFLEDEIGMDLDAENIEELSDENPDLPLETDLQPEGVEADDD